MAVKRTIPGTYVTLNDGNLVFNNTTDNPNVVVLGTAADGPAYTPVKVGKYSQIREALYGGSGSLVDGLHLMETTGSQSVFAVRIGSEPAIIQGIGGDLNKIQTVLQDASAGTNYKVAYDASAQRLQIVNELNTIVYDNNPSGTSTDAQEVIVRPVYGNTTDDIGVIDSVWIALEDISSATVATVAGANNYTTPNGAGDTHSFTLATLTGTLVTNVTFTQDVTLAAWTFDSTGAAISVTAPALITGSTFDPATGAVVLKWTPAGETVDAIDVSAFNHITAGSVIPVASGSVIGQTDATGDDSTVITIPAGIRGDGIATEVFTVSVDGAGATWTFNGAGTCTSSTGLALTAGSGFVYSTGILTLLWDPATEPASAMDITIDGYNFYVTWPHTIFYQAGSDGTSASKTAFFEGMIRAFDLLEATDVDIMLPVQATLDAPNVVDMTTTEVNTTRQLSFATYAATYGVGFPTAASQQDVLGKLVVEVYNGKKYFFWKFDPTVVKAQIVPQVFGLPSTTQTILDTGEYSIAEAIIEDATTNAGSKFTSASWKEVNFAWETAYFCYKLEVNDNSATCVIGTEPPVSYLTEDIISWIGTAPTLDINDNITTNGTGLRGNKFMAGKSSHGAGFWATDSGYLPVATNPSASSDVLKDDNNKPIQIGKYLSITANPVIQTSKSDVFGVGTAVSLHVLYGGSYGGVAEDFAMTNKAIPGVRLPFNLTKLQAEQLRDARYVTMIAGRAGTVVVEDVLATTATSDYQNLSTIRIVTQLSEDVRDELTQYIGQGLRDYTIASANTGILSVLNAYQRAGMIVAGTGTATASKRDRVLGILNVSLNVTPAFQLKTIPISLSLTVPQ